MAHAIEENTVNLQMDPAAFREAHEDFYVLKRDKAGREVPLAGLSENSGQLQKNHDEDLALRVQELFGASNLLNVKAYPYNAAGDGIGDDTEALQQAIDDATADPDNPKTVYLPPGTYRITEIVTARSVRLFGSRGEIWVDDPAAYFIMGGSSATSGTPKQTLKRGLRVGGAHATVPTVRIAGTKSQTFEIGRIDFLQLHADNRTSPEVLGSVNSQNSSIAYCKFYIDYADRVDLDTEALDVSHPQDTTQWINENDFWFGRCRDLRLAGTYNHNHNYFHRGSFEGGSDINFEVGADNFIIGARFEGSGNTITLAAGTRNNVILYSWTSSNLPHYRDDTVPVDTFTDDGDGNILAPLWRAFQSRHPVVIVNRRTCRTFTNVSSASVPGRDNYTSLRGVDVQAWGPSTFTRNSNRTVFVSDMIPATKGIGFSFNASVPSATTLFRMRIFMYDSTGRQIVDGDAGDQSTYIVGSNGLSWDAANNRFSPSSNSNSYYFVIENATVAYVKIQIYTGGSTTGVEFESFSLYRLSNRCRDQEWAHSFGMTPQMAVVAASPVIGWADEPGVKVSNTAGGFFTATASLDTTLTSDEATSATVITLASVTGIVSGGVIGIRLDSGAWHFTTVNGAPSGSDVTLTVALPSAASGSTNTAAGNSHLNRVVYNTWAAT